MVHVTTVIDIYASTRIAVAVMRDSSSELSFFGNRWHSATNHINGSLPSLRIGQTEVQGQLIKAHFAHENGPSWGAKLLQGSAAAPKLASSCCFYFATCLRYSTGKSPDMHHFNFKFNFKSLYTRKSSAISSHLL